MGAAILPRQTTPQIKPKRQITLPAPALDFAGLSATQVQETGAFLGSLQTPAGALPWVPGGQWDAWNHTEALMGLTVAGDYAGALLALEYLRATQGDDGSWPMQKMGHELYVTLGDTDTNQSAYPAVGLWHFYLVTADKSVLQRYWPMVDAALNHILAGQLPSGAIAWAISQAGKLGDHALLTGNASILQSLWCGLASAQELGLNRPHWQKVGADIARQIALTPDYFADRRRYSMDWFYPILGGVFNAAQASAHVQAEWNRFVWPEWGVRCVADHPWVAGGESAELVLALATLADTPTAAPAHTVFSQVQHLRDDSTGGYWTGYVVDDSTLWPREQTSWTAGAMLLAADALQGLTPAANFFAAVDWAAANP